MKITERFEIETELRQCPGCGRRFRVGAKSPTVFDSYYCRTTWKVEGQGPIRVSEPKTFRGEARLEPYRKVRWRANRPMAMY